MRTLWVALAVLLLALAASAKDKQMTGWISDASCASKPEAASAGHEECAKKCASGGGQLVFVSEADKKVWTVENPGFLKGLEGQRVSVTGATDNGRSVLRVRSVMQ